MRAQAKRQDTNAYAGRSGSVPLRAYFLRVRDVFERFVTRNSRACYRYRFYWRGSLLKLTKEREITGLTTAAGIWLTAAVGVAVGLGCWWLAALSIVLTWIILTAIGKIEFRNEKR